MIPAMAQIQIPTRASKAPGISSSSGFVSLVDATTMTDSRIFAGFLPWGLVQSDTLFFPFCHFSVSLLPILHVLIPITHIDLVLHDI